MDLHTALLNLDPLEDSHWTAEGLPRLDAVEGFLGEKISRKDLTAQVPGCIRSEWPPAGDPEPLDGETTPPQGDQGAKSSGAPDDEIASSNEATSDAQSAAQGQEMTIQDEIDALNAPIAAAQRKLHAVKAQLNELLVEQDRLIEERDSSIEPPHVTQVKRRKEELRREQARRVEEAERQAQLAKVFGAPPGPSPIDRARKNVDPRKAVKAASKV